MGLKNISIFEQHAEKIVLAVAAAGALAMGYLATRPVGFTDETSLQNPKRFIGPNDVEAAIADDVRKMDEQRLALEAKGRPTPNVPNYVDLYNRWSSDQPLDATILAARFPEFGPRNLRPGAVAATKSADTMACVVPDAPAPELLRAEVRQLSVANQTCGPDGAGIVVPEHQQLITQTRNVVVIEGWVPVGKIALQIVKQSDPKKRLATDLQRGVVYRVRVQRQERPINGSWNQKWEDVAPAQGAPAPAEILTTAMPDGDLPNRLVQIDSQFQWIQLPPYYVDSQGQPVKPPILGKPIPKSIVEETGKLHLDIETERNKLTAVEGFRPVPPPVGGGAVEAAMPSTMESIRALEVQPFAFWDDSVQSDRVYQYRVQIQCVNPAFGWKWGLDPASKVSKLDRVIPLNDNGFVAVPGQVVVHSDLAFFILGEFGTGINGQIFKQDGGRWYTTSFSALKGMTISAPMSIGGLTLDVDTKFAVVDYQDDGANVHVILKDPSGNLVTRDSQEDTRNPTRAELQNNVKQGTAAAAATATAPADGATPPATKPATRSGNR
jgi:hypothetical protein